MARPCSASPDRARWRAAPTRWKLPPHSRKSLRRRECLSFTSPVSTRPTVLPARRFAAWTFTVTNIGSFGCEAFTPVVNPPQIGILGVCNIQTKIKSAKGGVIETYPAMGLSLTFDHRVIDGAPAARYMSELCKSLEGFMTLMAK